MALPSSPILVANTMYATRSRIVAKPILQSYTGATGTATTDVVAIAGHTLVAGDRVEFTSGTGFTGLTAGTDYFVRDVVAATSFKVAATVDGVAVDITADGTAGVFKKKVIFEASKLDDESGAPTFEPLKMLDDAGVYRKIRTDKTAEEEKWTFVFPEVVRLLELFSGAMQGSVDAVIQLWIPDAKDAAGVCKLKSEEFTGTYYRSGNVSFGDGKHTIPTISVDSTKLGPVIWSKNASTT